MVNGLLLTRRCETTGEELADPISIESAARLQLVSRFILTGLTHSLHRWLFDCSRPVMYYRGIKYRRAKTHEIHRGAVIASPPAIMNGCCALMTT
jgi:hypothetical protein